MSSGKFRLIVKKKPEAVIVPTGIIQSVRMENNAQDMTFSYENLNASNLTNNQVLYEEGIPNDPSATYINISSVGNQVITTSPGSFQLHIVSNGIANQADKNVPLTIGGTTFNVTIDFISRPDTVTMIKETPNWTIPIIVTKQDILNHCSDFDGDEIKEWALNCTGNNDFVYNGQQYVAGTFVPLATIDQVGFSYVPVNNPLGYVIEYDHLVKDSTGLITKIS